MVSKVSAQNFPSKRQIKADAMSSLPESVAHFDAEEKTDTTTSSDLDDSGSIEALQSSSVTSEKKESDEALVDIDHSFNEYKTDSSDESVDLDANDLFNTDDIIPSESKHPEPAFMFHKNNTKNWLVYHVKNDMNRIRADVESWLPLSYEPIAIEHLIRAKTFLTCCQPMNKTDGNQLKLFVDNYGSLEEQEKMIGECANQTAGDHKVKCDSDIHNLKETRQYNIKLANEFLDKSILTLVDAAIKQPVYVDNVVYNYHLETANTCLPTLLVLWKPDLLPVCEFHYRTQMISKESTTPDDYKRFHEEISKPFRLMMANTYANLKVISNKIRKILTINNPVPPEEIDLHVSLIKNKIADYKVLNLDPMILHYGKRAHTYRVCCAQMETDDLFNQYLVNFYHDFHNMDKLLRNCLHKQAVPHTITGAAYGGDCQAAYNELTEAMSKRQEYLNKHKKQSGIIIKNYAEAFTPKLSQASIIKSMRDIVHQYCPDRHVFELMFDPEKVIHCEELIRKAIGKNDTHVYNEYDLKTSGPFSDIIINDWVELEKAHDNIASLLDVITSQPQNIPDVSAIIDVPKKNLPLDNEISSLLKSSASSIHQIFSIFFMIIIFF